MGREVILDLSREGPSLRDIAESRMPPREKTGVSLFLEKTTQRIGPVATAALEILGVTVVAGAASTACAPAKAPVVRPVETAVPAPTVQVYEVLFPIVGKGEGTAIPSATSKPAEKPQPTETPKALETDPSKTQELAAKLGISSKEPKESYVKFTRIVTEPKGEVLYFDPDSIIGQYAGLNLRMAEPEAGIDTLFSVRDGMISRAIEAETTLSSSNIDSGRDKLTALKKNIEGQSRADKDVSKVSGGKVPDIDRNGNGISDYLEPFYKTTVSIINQLQQE